MKGREEDFLFKMKSAHQIDGLFDQTVSRAGVIGQFDVDQQARTNPSKTSSRVGIGSPLKCEPKNEPASSDFKRER